MPVPQLAEALYEAHRHRSTGCLNVIAEGRESQLLLDRGNLVGAELRSGHRSLPQSLLRAGLIDCAKLDALWAEGQGAGPTAIEALGLQWTQACEIQTLSQIEWLSEKATHVHFEAGEVSGAFARIPGERVVRAAWLESDDGSVDGWMFRCIDPQRCERWLLSDAERQFIRRFETFQAPADSTPAQRALLELLSLEGAVERRRAPAPARAPEQEPDEASWAALLDDDPTPDPIVEIVSLVDDLQIPIVNSETQTAPGASNAEIPREVALEVEMPIAIAPLLGAFADRKTFSDDEEDVADDPSNPEQAARARRQRLLRRAMENMGGLGTRPAEASGCAVADEPAAAEAQSQAAPSADEMQLVASLERKVHQIESNADCFALLGVPRSATSDEVKAAFLELAKVFHPDRLPGSLQHLLAKMRAVFESVREAYETLQSESSRAAYEAGLDPEKPKEKILNPAQEAEEAFKRGEALFRKRDYARAEQEYHRAYFLDPKASYLAAEAWAIHSSPERREHAPIAKQMMAEAARKDPNCERAQYQLGVIARVEGDIDRAEKHFREAVRISPKHLEANQELRLIQMRKKKGHNR
jgi:curved DNA-binding protein CbpA